ncbi:LacI family DNA-binding transcriptional regulator [Noviherbaspirillum sedimenti]|uniref:LacI family DNA-binding transcriptional regulator n=1 Tax=Noviherbaspirillum sedimenti TaxID=2320865 RepID=A0A3A3G0L0_9BURK|nr:LacI family DNA-binding transcriptional regulator [Noviherbaspirillum sedimenti]RJG01461.1 LacI family DNA-binding transcriptional regulator [Noviherbaspirillum sedimenti]
MISRHSKSQHALAAPADRRPVTAHEVARLAGVSQSAVSRTYTEGASVSPDTREKVMLAAKQLGYRPNLVARSLITGRSNIVGVTIPSLSNPFYSELLEALAEGFGEIGYRIMLFTTNPDRNSDPVLEEVLRYRVDALVLVASNLSSHFADECQQIGLPVVLLNRKTNSKMASSVTGENKSGATQIAAFLAASDHQRFAYIAGLENSSTNRDREKAFTDYLQEHGYATPIRVVGNYTAAGAVSATRELLNRKNRPDAIFCANDQMALAAINVARTEFNLAVGSQISVVGFDDSELAGWPIFGLTTYAQPVRLMVGRVVDIVKEALGDKGMAPVHETVKGRLVVRESARIPDKGISIIDGVKVWHQE